MPHLKLLDPADARRQLDRYELIGELASGGMATVFLARLAGAGGFQRFYAIKRLHAHLAREQEFVNMFLDEARLAAGIHHPNVVPILEVGTKKATRSEPAAFYLAMEYVEGDTLERLVACAHARGERVPLPVAVRIMLDALAGLEAAHELSDDEGRPLQLVHRDCSPQNILVGVDGCSRLTDFGVARAASRLASTRSSRLKGKLAYMAPEQVDGRPIDRRADVFSMGIVLWEMLSGQHLFAAANAAATLSRVAGYNIPLLGEVMTAAPKAIEAVCARALARDLGRRFQSAAEMADALERAARADAGAPSDGVASPRDVASYVRSALGQELDAQRERVRAWLHQRPEAPEDDDAAPAPAASVSASASARPATAARAALLGAKAVASRDPGPMAISLRPSPDLGDPDIASELSAPSPRRVRGRVAVAVTATAAGMTIAWATLRPASVATEKRIDSAPARAASRPSEPVSAQLIGPTLASAVKRLAPAVPGANGSAVGKPARAPQPKRKSGASPLPVLPAYRANPY